MSSETCYMCELPETSREHAPPQCFFPEKKAFGRDLRRNLITVPSCDKHNSGKAKDDEFMRGVILMTSAPKSDAGRHQFLGKFLRAVRRKPKSHGAFFKDKGAVASGTGRALQIDRPRFDACVDHLVRALFFRTYRQKWSLPIASVSPNFYSRVEDGQAVIHQPTSQVVDLSRQFLGATKNEGANPEVFEYRMRHDEEAGLLAFAAWFYESFEVYAFSSRQLGE